MLRFCGDTFSGSVDVNLNNSSNLILLWTIGTLFIGLTDRPDGGLILTTLEFGWKLALGVYFFGGPKPNISQSASVKTNYFFYSTLCCTGPKWGVGITCY